MRTTRGPRRNAVAGVASHFRDICLALAGAVETTNFGHPFFRVGARPFATFHPDRISFKMTLDDQQAMLHDPRFSVAPYTGRYGWVAMAVDGAIDWDEVQAIALAAHALVAPKRTRRQPS